MKRKTHGIIASQWLNRKCNKNRNVRNLLFVNFRRITIAAECLFYFANFSSKIHSVVQQQNSNKLPRNGIFFSILKMRQLALGILIGVGCLFAVFAVVRFLLPGCEITEEEGNWGVLWIFNFWLIAFPQQKRSNLLLFEKWTISGESSAQQCVVWSIHLLESNRWWNAANMQIASDSKAKSIATS